MGSPWTVVMKKTKKKGGGREEEWVVEEMKKGGAGGKGRNRVEEEEQVKKIKTLHSRWWHLPQLARERDVSNDSMAVSHHFLPIRWEVS